MGADSINLRKFAGDVELTLGLGLGLSLGGDLLRPTEPAPAIGATAMPLLKACSLPIESEEEYRRRKAWQTLKRMEAKKRRAARLDGVTCGGGNAGENVGFIAAVSQPPLLPPVVPRGWGVGTSTGGVGGTLPGANGAQGSGGSSGVSDFEGIPMKGIMKK